MYGVAYGDTDRVQQVNVFTPFGREKPIVISNSLINYETGSITGQIFNNDYESTRQIDRNIIAKNRKIILNYLTNKSPKIIKDWNGNAWYAGNVYVGSTSGTNKDEGSKKLATEEYVNTKIVPP